VRKTGMEPWFQFWAKVRYAIRMCKVEWTNYQAYKRNMP